MKRKRLLITAAATVVAVTMAGIAWASIPGPGKVYSACMLKGLGTIRLIDKSLPSTNLMSHCTDKEVEISWNQAGQPGLQGAKGDPGAPGMNGTNGTDGKDGNLALAGRSCPDGSVVTGFDSSGDLVCAAPGEPPPPPPPPGEVRVDPDLLSFPRTQLGTISDAQDVILQNTGEIDVAIVIAVAGANPTDFIVGENDCRNLPAALPPAGSPCSSPRAISGHARQRSGPPADRRSSHCRACRRRRRLGSRDHDGPADRGGRSGRSRRRPTPPA